MERGSDEPNHISHDSHNSQSEKFLSLPTDGLFVERWPKVPTVNHLSDHVYADKRDALQFFTFAICSEDDHTAPEILEGRP